MGSTGDKQLERGGDRITVAQAAKVVGKAQTTIRRLVELGQIKSVKDETGKHWVSQQDVVQHYSIQAANVARQLNSDRAGATVINQTVPQQAVATAIELATLRERSNWLEKALQDEKNRVSTLEKQLESREKELFQIRQEFKALLNKETNGIWNWFRK